MIRIYLFGQAWYFTVAYGRLGRCHHLPAEYRRFVSLNLAL